MTDRLKGCVITFDADYRDDDAETIINAIKMIRGVGSVEVSVCDHEDWMNRERIRCELQTELRDVLKPKK